MSHISQSRPLRPMQAAEITGIDAAASIETISQVGFCRVRTREACLTPYSTLATGDHYIRDQQMEWSTSRSHLTHTCVKIISLRPGGEQPRWVLAVWCQSCPKPLECHNPHRTIHTRTWNHFLQFTPHPLTCTNASQHTDTTIRRSYSTERECLLNCSPRIQVFSLLTQIEPQHSQCLPGSLVPKRFPVPTLNRYRAGEVQKEHYVP